MLDLKFIVENVKAVKQNMIDRGMENKVHLVDQLVELNNQKQDLQRKIEELHAASRMVAKEFEQLNTGIADISVQEMIDDFSLGKLPEHIEPLDLKNDPQVIDLKNKLNAAHEGRATPEELPELDINGNPVEYVFR